MANGDERRDVKLVYRNQLVIGVSSKFTPSDERKAVAVGKKTLKSVSGRELSMCKILVLLEDVQIKDMVIRVLGTVNVEAHSANPKHVTNLAEDGFFGVITDNSEIANTFVKKGKQRVACINGTEEIQGCQNIAHEELNVDSLEEWLKGGIAY